MAGIAGGRGRGDWLMPVPRSQQERDEAYAYYLDEREIKVVLVGTAGPMSPDLAQNSTAVFVNG